MGAQANQQIPADVKRAALNACRRMGWSATWADAIADIIMNDRQQQAKKFAAKGAKP